MAKRPGYIVSLAWLVLFLTLSLPLLSIAGVEEAALVRVVPSTGGYLLGDRISVEVWVDDVIDLYGADVRLAFDPAQLTAIDASTLAPAVQVVPRDDLLNPEFVIRNSIDNSAGTIWYAVTQKNPSEPVSGSGALFSFTFLAQDVGWTAVTITYSKLASDSGTEIASEPRDAEYLISTSHRFYLPWVEAYPEAD